MGQSRRLEKLKRAVSEKAKELEEKYKLKEKAEEAAQAAAEVARRGAEAVAEGVQAARQRYERIDAEGKISDKVKRVADQVGEAVRTGSKIVEEKAGEVIGEVGKEYRKFESLSDFAKQAGRAGAAFASGLTQARSWIKQNPGKTAVVTFSLISGVRAGSAFPKLAGVLLGASSAGHWFFHSALAPYGLRKLSEKYLEYLKKQEALLAEGKLSEAETARREFQKNITKYVGAPLLGAFSVTLGATLIAEGFSPTRIVGLPLELILGGNPILNSVWLFSNGLICIHNGYKFFMIALAEEEEVTRVVREIKGLLPAET